jgi:hypothetical protein
MKNMLIKGGSVVFAGLMVCEIPAAAQFMTIDKKPNIRREASDVSPDLPEKLKELMPPQSSAYYHSGTLPFFRPEYDYCGIPASLLMVNWS